MLGKDPYQLPGPCHHSDISHGTRYNRIDQTVETYAKVGDDYQFSLISRIRPMCQTEKIHSLLRDYTREEVLKAYGVVEERNSPPVPPKKSFWDILKGLIP